MDSFLPHIRSNCECSQLGPRSADFGSWRQFRACRRRSFVIIWLNADRRPSNVRDRQIPFRDRWRLVIEAYEIAAVQGFASDVLHHFFPQHLFLGRKPWDRLIEGDEDSRSSSC
jgi:hypothetical protein